MEFPIKKEFHKILYINNRNFKNDYYIQNSKKLDTNNTNNNLSLTKVNNKIKIPIPILNQKISKKKPIIKSKLTKINNKDLLFRAFSYKTIEKNEINNKANNSSRRYSITKKINDSNSSIDNNSKKIIKSHKLKKENHSNDLNNTDIFQINKFIKNKGNITYTTDLKLDINNTNNHNDIKNLASLIELNNKILKRKVIPDLKNLNGLKKNLNNSSYNKNIKTAVFKNNNSGLTPSNYNSNNKNKHITQKLQLENNFISKLKNNIQCDLNQKPFSNISDNISINRTNYNYTERNNQTNIQNIAFNLNKNKNKKIGIFKNLRAQKFDSFTNTKSDIDSSRSNYYKNTSVNNSINKKYLEKKKPKIKFFENNFIKDTILKNKMQFKFLKKNKINKVISGSDFQFNPLLTKDNFDSKINYNINKSKKVLDSSQEKELKKIIFNNKLNRIKTKKLIKKDKILKLTSENNTLNSTINFKNKNNNKYIQYNKLNTSRLKNKNINKINKFNNNYNNNKKFENSERFSSNKNINESTNISFIKKLENKFNYLNINLNNWNNINNTTICNNNQNNTQNITIPTHINTFSDHSLIYKKKIKNKFMNKHNDIYSSKNLINSNNNIIILNNISMNNLNNISFDYLTKIKKIKNNNSYNNFEPIKKRLCIYFSKEKDNNILEINKRLEKKKEYYNNQKRIHKKKDNYKKINRIKEQNLNGFNLKQIKNKKPKKDLNKNHKFISHNKINSSINFNHHSKINIPKEHIHKHNHSNNFNIMINTNKINDNIANFINKNYSTLNNNQLMGNIIKNLKDKLKKRKEKPKIKSEQISPKKIIYKKQKNAKNINNLNQIKPFRHSHHIKKKIIKDNNKEKNVLNEFNNYFNKRKKNRKNCLSDLNEKVIEEIKSYKNTSNTELKKGKESSKKSFKSFSIDDKIVHKKGKLKIIKKEKKFLNILNNLNESLDKNQKYIKKTITDVFNPTENENMNQEENSNKIYSNPQHAEEYTTDIIESLLEEEDYYFNKKKYINPYYLENEDSELTPEMRTIVVDWLVLIHSKIFKFQENTLFLTVQIFDRYLSKVDLNTEQAELLLYTSFMLASKYNEIDYINMQEALKLSHDKFTKEKIIKMESEILNKLDFEILAPTMCEFFILFASFINLNQTKINHGLYILNIILVDYHMLKYPNFILAFAVIKLITKKENEKLVELIENLLKEKKYEKFLSIFNKEGYGKICKKIKLLYFAFLETKYKNIKEKFAEKEYNYVSKYASI